MVDKSSRSTQEDLELSLLALSRTNDGDGTNETSAVHTGSSLRNAASSWPTIRSLFAYPEKSKKALRSTAWLDGLRGLAAAEVVLHHYHLHFLGENYNFAYNSLPTQRQWWRLPIIRNYWHSAHAMVNVFFVISGFVLTQRSLAHVRKRQYSELYSSLSSAVFRRLVRIFAPVLAITFCGVLLVRLRIKPADVGFAPIHYQETFFEQVWDWYRASEKFLNPFHTYTDQWDIIHTYEHVMWTLPLEYYGSLICYVTILGVSRVRNSYKRTFIVLCVMYLALRRSNWWTINFLAGMLLADYSLSCEKSAANSIGKQTAGTKQNIGRFMWIMLFCWSFYVCGLPDPMPGVQVLPGYEVYIAWTPASFLDIEHGGRFWWMVAGTGLTVSISQLPLLRRLLETRFCQYLGKISFMMYLVHTYIWTGIGQYWVAWLLSLVTAESYYGILDAGVDIRITKNCSLVVYIMFWSTTPFLVALISALATRYIDEPSIKLARWLEEYFIKDE